MEEIIETSSAGPFNPFSETQALCEKIKNEIGKVIIGQSETIDLMVAGLLTGGHILLEGVPGIAKTLSAKMLAKTIDARFSRIQFTPDLMPSDVLGASVFNMKTSEFVFNQGPIFANIILIDEINRSPAKTQAALFEVMEESQATIEGNFFKMEQPFFVLATQNPIEQEGTYRLPEAQLDRFLFKIKLKFPSPEEELLILKRFSRDFYQQQIQEVQAVCSVDDIRRCKELVEKVNIKDELLLYITQIVTDTRNNGSVFLGASPRASLAIMKSSKAMAAINGRDFVTPDDIRIVTYHVLNHRIILAPEKEMEGIETEDVITEILEKIEVPR